MADPLGKHKRCHSMVGRPAGKRSCLSLGSMADRQQGNRMKYHSILCPHRSCKSSWPDYRVAHPLDNQTCCLRPSWNRRKPLVGQVYNSHTKDLGSNHCSRCRSYRLGKSRHTLCLNFRNPTY